MITEKTDEQRFWEEDADRVNAMCVLCKSKGFVIDVQEGQPLQLDEDGSLKSTVGPPPF